MGITIEDVITNNFQFAIQCVLYETDENGNKNQICQINDCGHKYSSASAAIRHIRKQHDNVYKTIQANKESRNESSHNTFFEIRVKVNPDKIWNACVDLVTLNALPLSAVEYPAFKTILKPYVIALKRQGIDLIVNRQNIKTKVGERVQAIKNRIISESKNKMVCLMLDIASRYNRSVLGVNISYFDDGKIRIRTIGMHVLRFSHTASNLKDLIVKNLQEFNIRLEQIIAVTTDNGKNLLKTIAFSNDELQKTQIFEDDTESDEFIDHDIFDDVYYEDLLAEVRSMFKEINHTSLIHGISCGAHCLHLVVTKALKKSPESLQLIEKCRNLAKKLRCPTFRQMLRSAGESMAILDVNTRWNSIYSMVNTKPCFNN